MLVQLLDIYIRKLVSHKELVSIKEIQNIDKTLIEIRVAASDLSRVIGKEGKIFRALRSLVRSIDYEGKRDIVVDIIA